MQRSWLSLRLFDAQLGLVEADQSHFTVPPHLRQVVRTFARQQVCDTAALQINLFPPSHISRLKDSTSAHFQLIGLDWSKTSPLFDLTSRSTRSFSHP